jgi:hypothetical protein
MGPSRNATNLACGVFVGFALMVGRAPRAFAQQAVDLSVLEHDGSFSYLLKRGNQSNPAARALKEVHATGCRLTWVIESASNGSRTESTAALQAIDTASLTVVDLDSAAPPGRVTHDPHFWQVEFHTRDGSSPVLVRNPLEDMTRSLPSIVFMSGSQAGAHRIGAVVAALVNRCQHS